MGSEHRDHLGAVRVRVRVRHVGSYGKDTGVSLVSINGSLPDSLYHLKPENTGPHKALLISGKSNH